VETPPAANTASTAQRLNYFFALAVVAACMYLPYVFGFWKVGHLDTKYQWLPIMPGWWMSFLDLKGRAVQGVANGLATFVALFGLSWLGSRSSTALIAVAGPTLIISVVGAAVVSLLAAASGIR
jgi:hypothetical protein